MPIKIKFWTIDDWNRPVFKSKTGMLYGSLEKLFHWGTDEETVLETVTEADITWFGSDIDDDPMGSTANVEIVKTEVGGI